MNTSLAPSRDLMRKFMRRTVLSLVFFGVVLFGAAGTLNWPQAWVYLAFTAALVSPEDFGSPATTLTCSPSASAP